MISVRDHARKRGWSAWYSTRTLHSDSVCRVHKAPVYRSSDPTFRLQNRLISGYQITTRHLYVYSTYSHRCKGATSTCLYIQASTRRETPSRSRTRRRTRTCLGKKCRTSPRTMTRRHQSRTGVSPVSRRCVSGHDSDSPTFDFSILCHTPHAAYAPLHSTRPSFTDVSVAALTPQTSYLAKAGRSTFSGAQSASSPLSTPSRQ